MFGPKWIDSVGHPPGSRLISAGYKGAFLYVGFPGRAKSATRAIVDDYRAAGLELACIVEDDANDALNPYNGGRLAQAAADHMHALGLDPLTPVECTADRHLTLSDVATALKFTDAFRVALRGAWDGDLGVYGFAEYVHTAWGHGLADWTHVAGAQSTVWGGIDTFWQDNTRKDYLGLVPVDVNYQLRNFRPLTPVEDTMDRQTLPSTPDPSVTYRRAIVLPIDRQAVITIGVEGAGTVFHGYGWGEHGGTGFDGNGPVVDQGVLVIRPPKGTGKVDVQYTSNSDLECVIDYIA